MNKTIIVVLLIVFIGGGYLLLRKDKPVNEVVQTSEKSETPLKYAFENPKKSAHYESNTPEHGSVLAGVPINVVIDFNFDLAKPSEIRIMIDGTEYGVGETVIDNNKLSMRRDMKADAPNGLYKVLYKACWPDGSCHDGHFQFVIDRNSTSNYEDLTNRKEIIVRMSEIKFNPKDIKISSGTKITWINDDSEVHYVNTETHPAHTYFPAQNSRAIKKSESFSTVFSEPGIYPYHCSAHASVMTGNILVE